MVAVAVDMLDPTPDQILVKMVDLVEVVVMDQKMVQDQQIHLLE